MKKAISEIVQILILFVIIPFMAIDSVKKNIVCDKAMNNLDYLMNSLNWWGNR